jgi:hypothetical protein
VPKDRRFSCKEIGTLVADPVCRANDGDNDKDDDWEEEEEEEKKGEEEQEEEDEVVWTAPGPHAM